MSSGPFKPTKTFKSIAGKASPAKALFETPMTDAERMELFFARVDAQLSAKDAKIAELQSEVTGKAGKIRNLLREVESLKAAAALSRKLNAHQGQILLLDASGSMGGAALKAALQCAQNDQSRLAVLWSDRQLIAVDTADAEQTKRAEHGLQGGSDFTTALETVAELCGPRHVVVVTDGDMQMDSYLPRAQEILRANPALRIDFIQLNKGLRTDGYAPLASFVENIQVDSEGRRPRLKNVSDFDAGLLETAIRDLDGRTRKTAISKTPKV